MLKGEAESVRKIAMMVKAGEIEPLTLLIAGVNKLGWLMLLTEETEVEGMIVGTNEYIDKATEIIEACETFSETKGKLEKRIGELESELAIEKNNNAIIRKLNGELAEVLRIASEG